MIIIIILICIVNCHILIFMILSKKHLKWRNVHTIRILKAEIIDEIGSELRKARNAKELTLAQVADNLEQNGTHVSGIMLGRIEKTVSVVLMILLLHALLMNYIILIRTILQ